MGNDLLNKNLYREQQSKTRTMSQTAQQHQASRCPNCGAPIAAGAKFCEECGASLGGDKPAGTFCTFCGSEISGNEALCPECGNPRGGIVCPDCGTLNYRSFCRKCDRPLNPMALYAIEKAKSDPRVKRAVAVKRELDQMEAEIARLEKLVANESHPTSTDALMDTSVEQSEATRRLMEDFAELSGTSSEPAQQEQRPQPTQQQQQSVEKATQESAPVIDWGSDSQSHNPGAAASQLEELKKQYAAKSAEFQQALNDLIPDPADPPEIQRNFACAAMVTILTTTTTVTKERKRVAWVCNKCNIRHTSPSDCGVREFGGNWIYEDITKVKKTTTASTHSVNL